MNLHELIRKYADGGNVTAPDYRSELAAARDKAAEENQVYNDLIQSHITSGESPESKSEMWFKLAAALGAPTKTGSFGETLSNAAGALGEYKKDARAEAVNKLQLALDAQKNKALMARDNVNSIRDMYKIYQEDQAPKSAAGKQALDEGLPLGSPEYQGRVKEIGNLIQQQKQGAINAQLASLNNAGANLDIAREGLTLKQNQAHDKDSRLSPTEIKMREEVENGINAANLVTKAINRAFELNKTAFDNTPADLAQRAAMVLMPDNEKMAATTEFENLLQSEALQNAKLLKPASDTDIKLLQSLSGLGSKSKIGRGKILMDAYQAAQRSAALGQEKLNKITSGAYRTYDTQPTEEQQ